MDTTPRYRRCPRCDMPILAHQTYHSCQPLQIMLCLQCHMPTRVRIAALCPSCWERERAKRGA